MLGTPSIGVERILDGMIQAGSVSAVELLEMRIVLDSSAAALASMQPKNRLSNAVHALDDMHKTADAEKFAELDARFHEAVVVASGNRLFHLVFKALHQLIRKFIEARLRTHVPGRDEILKQHASIIDAIRSGDAKAAAAAARSHLWDFYCGGLSAQERARVRSFVKAVTQITPEENS